MQVNLCFFLEPKALSSESEGESLSSLSLTALLFYFSREDFSAFFFSLAVFHIFATIVTSRLVIVGTAMVKMGRRRQKMRFVNTDTVFSCSALGSYWSLKA